MGGLQSIERRIGGEMWLLQLVKITREISKLADVSAAVHGVTVGAAERAMAGAIGGIRGRKQLLNCLEGAVKSPCPQIPAPEPVQPLRSRHCRHPQPSSLNTRRCLFIQCLTLQQRICFSV